MLNETVTADTDWDGPVQADATIDDLIDDFDFLDSWEDRYRYLIDLGRQKAHVADADRVPGNMVEGCMSQVWLTVQVEPGDPPRLHFQADSDAHIVRGLIAVLLTAYSGRTPQEILAVTIEDVFARLGLDEHLSPNRRNGFFAITGMIRGYAQRVAAAA